MQTEVPESITAIVSAVYGGHKDGGAFVVTLPQRNTPLPFSQKTSITFSLTDWQGDHQPRRGEMVILSVLQKFAKGWRALQAQPQATITSKKQKGDGQ